MTSIDTNILLYAQNIDCPEHRVALDFVTQCGARQDIVLSELALVELYLLLRNPAVFAKPLGGKEASEVCQAYRRNPRWRLVENAPVMEGVWDLAAGKRFPRRRIIDARLALTLLHHGVRRLATANTKDFVGFGFERVWNPLAPDSLEPV